MKNKVLEIRVSNEYVSQRIDKFIVFAFKELTRAKVQSLIEGRKVLINNNLIEKTSYKVKLDDLITINIEAEATSRLTPAAIDLDVVYEDDYLIVINKPIDMVVHPAAGHQDDTLVNALLYHFSSLSTINGEFRPGIVHRIDKDTSGLLLVAKNDLTHQLLAKDIKSKLTDRRYYALVNGEIRDQQFVIEAPIGRSRKNRKKMAVVSDGKSAKTEFKVIERFSGYTLLEAKLFTGRTHQIRVHLNHIGHPIEGDQLYGKRSRLKVNHQLLHAYYLSFNHPILNKTLTFKVDLPSDFKEVIKQLRHP
jgi:23S rRNA pseudouridine1911/1915/1917 synthase